MARKTPALLVIAVLAVGTAAAPIEPVAPDLRVSTMGTDGDDAFAALAPSAAYNPVTDEYLVVWTGDDDTGGLANNEYEVHAQLVSGDGTTLAGSRIRVSQIGADGDADYGSNDPAVAYNATANEYLVVWAADDDAGGLANDENEIYGQRLAADGTEIGADDFRISAMGPDGDVAFDALTPQVTWQSATNEYLVVWVANDDGGGLVAGEAEVFAQRLASDGTEAGADDFRISDMGGIGDGDYDAVSPALTFNPVTNEYLVVWYGSDNAGALTASEFEIYGQRLALDGTEVGVNDFRISHAGPDGDDDYAAALPTVAANAHTGDYLVVYSGDVEAVDEYEVYAQRLDSDGIAVGPEPLRVTHAGTDGDTTSGATYGRVSYVPDARRWVVVYLEAENGAEAIDVFARPVSATGSVGDAVGLSSDRRAENGAGYPVDLRVAAAGDGEALAVWNGEEAAASVDDQSEIYARAFAVAGTSGTAGYGLVGRDGGTFTFGDRRFHGSLTETQLNAPLVAAHVADDDTGQWLFAADGGVFTQGDATFYGSRAHTALPAPIGAAAMHPGGDGYWLVGETGKTYEFGAAPDVGDLSVTPNRPIVAAAPTPSGDGLWLFAADGGVFALGDADFYGSMGGRHLNREITAAVSSPSGDGYWLFAADGGVFAFGDADFYGSLAGIRLNRPVVAARATTTGLGYWMYGADGGVFAFGDAEYFGSLSSIALNAPIVAAT